MVPPVANAWRAQLPLVETNSAGDIHAGCDADHRA